MSESLLERLDGKASDCETWKPEPGDILLGRVVDLDEAGNRNGVYPVVIVQCEDGRRFAWHAAPTVAQYELSHAGPQVGDLLAVRYEGKVSGGRHDGGYHSFTVRSEPRRIDWSRYRRPARPAS